MTLRFLGNTDSTIIPDLLEKVSDDSKSGSISYEIDKFLIFPSASKPRIVAATIAENTQLNELVHRLEKSVQSFGFQAEQKSFRGHFTLGRCRRDFPKKVIIDYPIDSMRSEATEMVLYHSVTKPSGAVYTSLGSIRL